MFLHTENVSKFAFSNETTNDPDDASKFTKFGILGVPFDGTASYMSGARFGPRSVREASYNFEAYNFKLKKTIPTGLLDIGDLEVVHGNFKKTCAKLRSTIDDVLNQNIVPITIGGDHSISYCIIKSLTEALGQEKLTVIHFDAHMDLREEYEGEKYSHATVMRRIMDLNPQKIIQIGVRSADKEEAELSDDKLCSFSSYHVFEDIENVIDCLKDISGPIYVSFDIDVLDPAYAPSTGTPSPCGLNPMQVEKLMFSLESQELVGMDIVEVASSGIGDSTAMNAAKIILDFLCMH
jgi:agmatinase